MGSKKPPGMPRRDVLAGAAGVVLAASTAAEATVLVPTPAQTRGPFYPLELPLDKDNDLVVVDGGGRAKGQTVHVFGRVLDTTARPVDGALVEIWQCDANGRYHHPWDRGGSAPDPNFQGYGRTTTGADGAYRFRTIRPVAYPGRTPHIHFAISAPGFRPLVTQMYVAGEPLNEHDGVLRRIRDPRARANVIVEFEPHAESGGEVAGNFDIVLTMRS